MKKENIREILEKNTEKVRKLTFGKNDLKFIKSSKLELILWLNNFQNSLQVLNTFGIDMEETLTNELVTLPNLKKLCCRDTLLTVLDTQKLEDIRLFTTDHLKTKNLENINNFLIRHHSIKKFSFRVFCGEDIDIQNVDFKLDHLKLEHFILAEFRFNPTAVLKILECQNDLVKLHLEDGYLSSEDVKWTATKFEPIFNRILKLKKLEKLVIEMPTINFVRKLKSLPNLKRLYLNAISMDVLAEFLSIEFPNLKKLCLEGVDFGKKSLRKEDIWLLSRNFKNLQTFKFDTVSMSVIDCILRNMENLKNIKILRNMELIRKMKSFNNENIKLSQCSLQKIVCEHEDFRIRILPIIKVSPQLRHVTIYWNNKQTAFMTTIFDILEYCNEIKLIEFKSNGIFVKDDSVMFRSHFSFSYNCKNYQLLICRKNGKIKCCKI